MGSSGTPTEGSRRPSAASCELRSWRRGRPYRATRLASRTGLKVSRPVELLSGREPGASIGLASLAQTPAGDGPSELSGAVVRVEVLRRRLYLWIRSGVAVPSFRGSIAGRRSLAAKQIQKKCRWDTGTSTKHTGVDPPWWIDQYRIGGRRVDRGGAGWLDKEQDGHEHRSG